jgi:hypothetical protein
MGYILEETFHPTLDEVTITVDEKTKDEIREPWAIMSLNISFSNIRTPDDYIELGKWIAENATRIKREYTSTGKKRKTKS